MTTSRHWKWKLGEINMHVFTNPSAWAGCDTRSIFKWISTGLNSEFSFSETGCHT